MKTSTQVARWGNSLGLRIPKSVATEAGISEGDKIELSTKNGEIVLRPARPTYTLSDLVGKITPKNRHEEVNWGPRKGHEQW